MCIYVYTYIVSMCVKDSMKIHTDINQPSMINSSEQIEFETLLANGFVCDIQPVKICLQHPFFVTY